MTMTVKSLIKELNNRFRPDDIVKVKILSGLGVWNKKEHQDDIYFVSTEMVKYSKKLMKQFEESLEILEVDD